MQVLISSSRPSNAFLTSSASASMGLAMETKSASPSANTCSATSGILMRLLVMVGMLSSLFRRPVTPENAARGTIVAIVGTADSCQVKCVLIIVAPAFSISLASNTTSSQDIPPCNISIAAIRKIKIKFSPTSARQRRIISKGKRIRFS